MFLHTQFIFHTVSIKNDHSDNTFRTSYGILCFLLFQCLGFSKALNNVLQVEQGLDAIRKEHKKSKDKIDGLQKQVIP